MVGMMAQVAGGLPLAGYDSRAQFTVDATKVAADETGLLMMLDVDEAVAALGSGLWSNTEADGGDLRVTKADGTTLVPSHVHHIDNGAAEELRMTFLGDISSSVDTDFYLYWNNSGQSAPARDAANGLEAVWVEYLIGYGSLFPDIDASPCLFDCTANQRDPNRKGSRDITESTDGPFYQTPSFTTNTGASKGVGAQMPADYPMTLEAIVYHDGVADSRGHGLAIAYNLATDEYVRVVINSSGFGSFGWVDGATVRSMAGSSDLTDGVYHHLVATLRSATDWELYVDGVSVATHSTSTTFNTNLNVACVGYLELFDISGEANDQFAQYADFRVPMARWSDVARDDDWVSTAYETLINQSTFIKTWGAVET